MSLRIVYGRADTDKSEFIVQEIQEKLRSNPNGNPIFFIVPEQMTFQLEYALFNEEIKGSIRAQVVSFSRLAWRVLQETGGSTRQFISSTGIQMMLRKIIDQRVEQFSMFQKAVDKQGFIEELEGIITEFKRHCITPDMLQEQLHYIGQNVPLTNKLTDLHYIYHALSALLQHKYIDGEDQLQLLANKISGASFLHDADIYIDGFYRFTPNELEIVAELLKVSKQVNVALILDPTELGNESSELDLFYQTKETYYNLHNIANENDILIEEPIPLNSDNGKFHDNPQLFHLEKFFDDRPTPVYTGQKNHSICLYEAVHPRAELDGVIQEILRLVREENYRYKDMVIFVRETKNYHDLIRTMFKDYNIPVFIDEKRTMLNHPFIEFIRSLFDVIESNWRYDAIFRLLKTGLIRGTDKTHPLTMDAIDELENYCLEYGIRGKKQWLQEGNWIYKRFRGFTEAAQTDRELEEETKINCYRKQVVDAIEQIDQELRGKRTTEERCEAIYLFLERLHIPKQLEERRTHFDTIG